MAKSEDWVIIVSARRAVGKPISSPLWENYWTRDEALREQHCDVPQIHATASDGSWTTVFGSYLWVPTWASRLNVGVATFMDTSSGEFRLLLNATTSSALSVNWTVTQDDVLTIDVVSGDPGAMIELEFQDRVSGVPIMDITLKRLWWSQEPAA